MRLCLNLIDSELHRGYKSNSELLKYTEEKFKCNDQELYKPHFNDYKLK